MARREAEKPAPAARVPWPALAAATAAYLALLLWRYRWVPDGLVNDAAEEALRGVRLLHERRLEVITFTLGNSAETLWLYVVGLSAKLLGPTVLAVVLPSMLAAAATLLLTALLVLRLAPGTPAFVPLLLAAGSPWLFHYGRSGFRAIAAPLFLAASALSLAGAARRPGRTAPFALAGGLAALGVYAYTACRLLPLALALALGVAIWSARGEARRAWIRGTLAAAAAGAVVSIPNLVFLVRRPGEFLTRGGYVLVGTSGDRVRNAIATALLPLAYPDRYRTLAGPAHFFDGASAGLTSTGIDPVPLLAGVLFAAGLVLRLRRSRDAATLYLAFTVLLAVVFLGPAGPSLTRLLLVVPAIVAFASFGAAPLAGSRPGRLAVAALLAAAAALSLHAYFSRMGDPRFASPAYAAGAATAMGERARALGAADVVCVVSANANVVRYLAPGARVVEFYGRPFEPAEVPAARTILVERWGEFGGFIPEGMAERGDDPRFCELAAR